MIGDTGWLATTDRTYGAFTQTDAYLAEGSASLRFDRPVAIGAGWHLIRIGGALFEGLPRRPEIAELIFRRSGWRENDLQLVSTARHQYAVQLKIPSSAECLDATLTSTTDSYESSPAGALGEAFAARGGTEALLEPGILATIRTLTTPRRARLVKELGKLTNSATDAEQLAALVRDWGDNRSRTYKSVGDLPRNPSWDRHITLETLVDLNWAERGYEFACQMCRARTFLSVEAVPARGSTACPACQTPGRLVKE